MTKRKHAINSSDLTGSPFAQHDAHCVTRTLRAVTVVFWPAGYESEWSYEQPEATDADMAARAAKGRPGAVWIYRNTKGSVNTTRDTPSAEIEFPSHRVA